MTARDAGQAGFSALAEDALYDLAVIGGGINGCGIARDAAGRGLSVLLVEQDDLAQGTSSASTKLFHGGLRYLEQYAFRLVREALAEREVLLRAMPHIAWPLRFVLPHHRGLRPAWLLRLGLFLYDHLGGRDILPGTRSVDFATDPTGAPLQDVYRRGFEYSDCWVDDSRLVVLNARDAADRGARVLTRTRCETAERAQGLWRLTLEDRRGGARRTIAARALVNAAGPWVGETIGARLKHPAKGRVRLVRGSHLVTRRLFEHDRAYIFQQSDGRIVFAIPYERDFTLIGTTDVDHEGPPGAARCSEAERDYLLAAVAGYLKRPPTPDDVVWTYSGVRPLYDDGAKAAAKATRDYVLELDRPDDGDAPLLTVFGGKLTTYRRLAESALARLAPFFPAARGPWTAGAPLPGGAFPVDGVEALARDLTAAHPYLSAEEMRRLVRAYGTEARAILAGAGGRADLGRSFGAGLTEREVEWLIEREWAMTADDVLWRRGKLGLRLTGEERAALDAWMSARLGAARPHAAE